MAQIEPITLISEAAVSFESGEQMAADLPSYPVGAALLKREFGFETVQIQQGEQSFWLAQKGQVQIGNQTYRLDAARGNLRMLAIAVHGNNQQAFDVLQELWARLTSVEKELFSAVMPPHRDFGRVQSLGRSFIHTYAIVRFPFTAKDLFPQLAFVQNRITAHMGAENLRVSKEARLRFTCELHLEWGAKSILTPVIIEPRANEPMGSGIFYTRSPLPLTEHLKFLQDFVDTFSARNN